jgi:putative tryptophan/tyrosine transport system permease protein
MSLIAFLGAIESGLIYALVALGIYLSFRVLEFPDLTVDGSFPLGAAVSAVLIINHWDPWLATGLAMVAGAVAGMVTAWLNVKLKILHLLASILTMIALYSINLRIMGRPNIALLGENTILSPIENWDTPFYVSTPIIFFIVVVICALILVKFLNSETGLAMRATGANPRMARAQGVKTAWMILTGMAVSNALVALAGSLFAQSQGSADVTMGVGVIVIGLASVIGGEAIITPSNVLKAAIACIVGAILYRLAIAFALNLDLLGLKAQDLNLVTSVLVMIAIVLPRYKLRKAS